MQEQGWRAAMTASGVLLVAGGRLHPDAEATGTVGQELAQMTADDRWVPGHALILASTVLLAVGLHLAARQRDWPARVRRPLRLAAVAVSLYVVEATAHLAAAVDADALREGGSAPVAWTHVVLSAVLYPVTGAALVVLGLALLRSTTGVQRATALLAVLAGTVHAVSVPFTLLLPDAEATPLFVGAAVLLALWSVATAVTGGAPVPSPARAPRVQQPVA